MLLRVMVSLPRSQGAKMFSFTSPPLKVTATEIFRTAKRLNSKLPRARKALRLRKFTRHKPKTSESMPTPDFGLAWAFFCTALRRRSGQVYQLYAEKPLIPKIGHERLFWLRGLDLNQRPRGYAYPYSFRCLCPMAEFVVWTIPSPFSLERTRAPSN